MFQKGRGTRNRAIIEHQRTLELHQTVEEEVRILEASKYFEIPD